MKRILAPFAGIGALVLIAMAAQPANATCFYGCGGDDEEASASFGGFVFSENQAGAIGKLTYTESQNWKEEGGFAEAYVDTDGKDGAAAGAFVATGGSASAGSIDFGYGSSFSATGVSGVMGGAVEVEASEN